MSFWEAVGAVVGGLGSPAAVTAYLFMLAFVAVVTTLAAFLDRHTPYWLAILFLGVSVALLVAAAAMTAMWDSGAFPGGQW